MRLIVNGEANPRIQLPTIPSAKLAAHRAAHEIFGAPTSHAEDLEAGFIPRPASKLDMQLKIMIVVGLIACGFMLGGALIDWNTQMEWARV